jgi:hypothetical protein
MVFGLKTEATCSLQLCINYLEYVRFEVFTAVTMKNGVFWVVVVVLTRATRRNNPEDTILYLEYGEKFQKLHYLSF